MTSEQFRTLGLWMVIALVAAGVSLLGYRWRVRRRQRDASWSELCLRLELAPVPGEVRVASGSLQGIGFSLHDTGSRWLLEVPLAQPLLPPGVVLLPAKAPRLESLDMLRPLRVGPLSDFPGPFAWYAGRDTPHGKVDASGAFLVEATRAMEAHAPLEVWPHRLIHTLRAGPQLSVGGVREAVRALDATARRWLDTVALNGLPRVDALPPSPPRARMPLKRARTVLGGLVILFSCFLPFLTPMREVMKEYTTEYTGQVVDSEWIRNLIHTRCPDPFADVRSMGCSQPMKLVDYVTASGRYGERPRWPEPPSMSSQDVLERDEKYTLHIEYEDGGKKVITHVLRSAELYRVFGQKGQQVYFTLRRGRVNSLRLK